MIQIPSWELVKKYDRPGPRYTSYPTAPEFKETFGPAAVRGAPRPRRPPDRAALDLRAPPVLPRDVPLLRVQRRGDPRPVARRRLPRPAREGGRARRREAAEPPRGVPAPLGRRHAHLPRREAAHALPRDPRAPLHVHEGRREGGRDRPRDHPEVADRDAREARVQPDLHGRAGLRRQGAAGRRPHPGREGDRRARRRGARERLPRREPRPHLRAAVPDAGDLEADARPDRRDPPGPARRLRLRVRPLVEAAPAAAAAGGAAEDRAARRALPRRRGGVRRARGTASSASITSRSRRTSSRRRRTAGTSTGTSRATRSARRRTRWRSG